MILEYFFDGIDYENAINNGVKHFRIDGKVSGVVLENYSPTFTVPYGATILRYIGNGLAENDQYNASLWTDILETDYVGFDDSETVVVYMVTSEDESNRVFYHITATDIDYNLTLRFVIYYEYEDAFGNLQRILANDSNSPIKNQVVLISLRNLKMRDLDLSEAGKFLTTGNFVDDFPEIESSDIVGINNQSSLYYFIGQSHLINYRFGRNSTGIYNFSIVAPKI